MKPTWRDAVGAALLAAVLFALVAVLVVAAAPA